MKGERVRGLAVASLGLSHFRSYRGVRMVFDGRPVAFVGPNGAGKTNILEAVSLLSPGRGLRRAGADEIARRPEVLGWKVSAAVRGLHSDHEVETWAECGGARQVRIDGKAATQVMLGRILRIVWLVPAMDRLWTEAAEGRRRFLDRVAMSFAPDHAEAVLDYEKAMRERNRLLKEGVGDAHWYAALEGRMAEAAALIVAHRAVAVSRLMRAQADAGGAFPRAELDVASDDPEDLRAAWAEGRRRDMAAGRTLVGPHRADLAAVYAGKGVLAGQCSTGEQKALLISMILANARALAEDLGAAPVLLLDEVAAHLDEGRREALYDEICTLGAQALMTGTGPELFSALGSRAQRFEVTEVGGLSQVCEMGP